MQTTGAVLLTAKWCSPACVLMPAQDSPDAYGLLYLAAVPSRPTSRHRRLAASPCALLEHFFGSHHP